MNKLKPWFGFLVLALSCALAACREDPPTEPPVSVEPRNLSMTLVKGNHQVGVVGEFLPDTLIVRLTDKSGRPIPNLSVGWVVLSEKGGEPFLATVVTDERGYARNFWKLGPLAAEHQMEVRAIVDGAPTVLDTIHATARPGPAVSAWLVGDSVQAVALGRVCVSCWRAWISMAMPLPPAI